MSEWAEFGRGLTEALRDVADRVFLIVFLPGDRKRYVQFAGGEHELEAQAAGPEVVPWAEFGGVAEAGWVAPSGFDPPNWTFTLPLPALTAEYAALAERCVVALRDAYRVSDPGSLVYRAWREGEWPPANESWSDERIAKRDQGEDPLEMPWLKIPPVHG